MILQQLFEMPRLINDIDFNLDNYESNQKRALSFMKDSHKREICRLDKDHVLYALGHSLALIDIKENYILYFMQWKELRKSVIGVTTATQIAVWKTVDDPYEYGDIPKIVFFDGLLGEYDAIASDIMQTRDGRRFWINRVEDSFKRNLHLYYVNFLQNEKNTPPEVIKINDIVHFRQLRKEKDFWGEEHKYEARRIIISKVLLKNNK